MRRRLQWVTAASAAGVAAAAALLMPRIEQARERERWGMLETYCSECHNADDRAGDLTFDALTPASVPEHAEIFEAAVRKLRGRLMPPPGSPQPEQREIDGLVAWLERSIDGSAAQHEAGYVPAQRLSRSEYAHVVKDLLGCRDRPEPSSCRPRSRSTASRTSPPR